MRSITSFFIAFVLSSSLLAQVSLDWAKSIGTTSNENIQNVSVDQDGYVYSAGNFQNTVDFDPGPGIHAITAQSTSCSYIQKLDSSGNFVWAIPYQAPFKVGITTLFRDDSGYVYIAGMFHDSVDMDPDTTIFKLYSVGSSDIFISKLTSDGQLIWAKSTGGLGAEKISSITVDAGGNIYCFGDFDYNCDFDPDTSSYVINSTVGLRSLFILKLDKEGEFIWAGKIGGSAEIWGHKIHLDKKYNRIYVTGSFKNTVDFDPGTSVKYLYSSGDFDSFIARYSPTGGLIWAGSISGNGYDVGTDITTDNNGLLYATGWFEGQADLCPLTCTYNKTASGLTDVYLVKLQSNGLFVWAKNFGGSMAEHGWQVILDSLNNIYISGVFAGTVDFDPSTSTYSKISAGWNDIYLSKFNNSGDFQWVRTAGGTGNDYSEDLFFDKDGALFEGGRFSSNVDFDPASSVSVLTSNGALDVFIRKLSICQEDKVNLTETACNSYVFNGTTYSQSGKITASLLNSKGCDSIVTLDLTIVQMQKGLTDFGDRLIAKQLNVNYQWLDCNDNMSIIPGETNREFIPKYNGIYAVVISKDMCADTSDCYQVIWAGVDDLTTSNIHIYPNPTNDILHIDLGEFQSEVSLILRNDLGQVVLEKKLKAVKETTIDLSGLAKGIYSLSTQVNGEVYNQNVIKK